MHICSFVTIRCCRNVISTVLKDIKMWKENVAAVGEWCLKFHLLWHGWGCKTDDVDIFVHFLCCVDVLSPSQSSSISHSRFCNFLDQNLHIVNILLFRKSNSDIGSFWQRLRLMAFYCIFWHPHTLGLKGFFRRRYLKKQINKSSNYLPLTICRVTFSGLPIV